MCMHGRMWLLLLLLRPGLNQRVPAAVAVAAAASHGVVAGLFLKLPARRRPVALLLLPWLGVDS